MFTIFVTLMAMRGYFGGCNIKIYIVIDLIIIAMVLILKAWEKVMKITNKK